MDRIETYIGQSIYEWDFSKPDQNKMVALAKITAAIFGTNTFANGLACTPQSPNSMLVNIGAGELYQLESLEATACGTLPADTTHQIMKQGIALDAVVVPNANTGVTAFTPPVSSGQSINYLIEAQYADVDVSIDPTTGASPVVLNFYNSANPTQPYQGPNNTGSTSNTFRKGVVSLQVKAGVAATGSQITPTPDAGFVGLWVVSVPFGATALSSANIAQYASAPVLPSSVLQSIQTDNLTYGVDVSATPGVVQATYPLAVTALTDNMNLWVRIKNSNTGATTFTPNPGVITAYPVIGGNHSALQGGELVANGRSNLLWRADISSWVLMESSGGALQIAPATQGQHAVSLNQLASVQGLAKNLQAFTSGTSAVVILSADEIVLEDTVHHLYVTLRNVSLTASTGGASGVANSLDTGAWAYSTWYARHVIYNPLTATAALLWSLSKTAPTLPAGYTFWAFTGWELTQSASNYWPLGFNQFEKDVYYKVALNSNVPYLPLMSFGVTGNPVTPTYTAIPWAQFAPPDTHALDLVLRCGSATSSALVAPNTAYGATNDTTQHTPPLSLSIGSSINIIAVRASMQVESANIYTANGDSIYGLLQCAGFRIKG